MTVLDGDVRDTDTISKLLKGCDAVLHAAGVVGTDNRREQLMWDINAYATEAILTRAADQGLDRSAFWTAPGVTEKGWAPIVRYGIAPRLRGGMQMVDVRDIARVHEALMRPGRGPRRYVCGGVMLTFDEMISALETGIGRPIRRIPVAPTVFRGLGRIADVLGRMIPLGDGLSYEAAMLLTAATPTDDSKILGELGVRWRSPVDAIVDSLQSRNS
jgi:dihydroflavonol-4-reductase